MWKKSLIYGLIGAAIIIVCSHLPLTIFSEVESMSFAMNELYGYFVMIVALSTIFFGIRSYRDQELDGKITFGKAFTMGLMISLVAGILYVIAWMLLSGPEFAEAYAQQYIDGLKASGATEAEIQKAIADTEYYTELNKNPFFKAGITFMEIFPVGLMISLGSAFFLQTKNDKPVTDTVN